MTSFSLPNNGLRLFCPQYIPCILCHLCLTYNRVIHLLRLLIRLLCSCLTLEKRLTAIPQPLSSPPYSHHKASLVLKHHHPKSLLCCLHLKQLIVYCFILMAFLFPIAARWLRVRSAGKGKHIYCSGPLRRRLTILISLFIQLKIICLNMSLIS